MSSQRDSDVKRLESLWSGDFGDSYVDRNSSISARRSEFWTEIVREFPIESVLEVGCSAGVNLSWLAQQIDPARVFGVEVNQKSLAMLRRDLPEINAVSGVARELPFRDRWFDLVFTTGVLIHQPVVALPLVMAEIVRCSRRYVLCGEYYADEPEEVEYRGHDGALFKRDFGGLYLELFPELVLLKKGFLTRDQGWDDVTYWVFEKPAAER